MTDRSSPDTYPTTRQWSEHVAAVRRRLLEERPRAFPPGDVRTCPSCGAHGLRSRDDLVRENVSGAVAVVHHNLHGARCDACGGEFLESYELVALEESGAPLPISDYLARITNVSGRNLGTYWPKDVVGSWTCTATTSCVCMSSTRTRC